MRDQVALPTYIDWMVHRFLCPHWIGPARMPEMDIDPLPSILKLSIWMEQNKIPQNAVFCGKDSRNPRESSKTKA